MDFRLENGRYSFEAQGRKAAARIVAVFGTRDVFAIAEKAGVKIIYARWFPVTIGEYHRKTNVIGVNLNARQPRETIIAHELGHFFAGELKLNRADEEIFCHAFAASLSAAHRQISCEKANGIVTKNKNYQP